MDLLDLLDKAGGAQSLGKLAGNLGIDASKANDLIGALAPSLMGGMQKQTNSQDALSGFKKALQNGNHQQYLDNPDLMSSAKAVSDGNGILGHLLGSKDASRQVAAQAAESTGIDASLIKKALPLIAGLVMGTVSKNSDAGNSMTGSIGDMFGDFGLDDALDLAKKFF